MQAMRSFLARVLARMAYAVNATAPGVKRLLPKSLRRFLLLNVLGAQRGYPDVSRKVLETEILPEVARRHAKVLFVGTGSYTYRYERLFRRGQYTTIDSNPSNAVWGADDHIVGLIQELPRLRPPGSLDCVVLNGVFGFGVNDPDTMRAVAKALAESLQPNGSLIVGWNTDMHDDPERLNIFTAHFRRAPEPRRTFPGETHVYDFYVRQ